MIPSAPESTPKLTAIVAHELNNILTVVRTYAHFARASTSAEQIALDLRAIAAAAERAMALTDWLGLPAESVAPSHDEVSSDEFLPSLVDRLQQLLAPGIVVEARHGAKDLCFKANALRLEHVLVSLVLAASQGFARASFVLTAQPRSVLAGQHAALSPGPYTAITIACRAGGQVAPAAEHTSAAQQVAELLSPLVELVRTMHGELVALDRDAGGDGFEILLPALAQPARPKASARTSNRSLKGKTVCVIEDETAIRLAMRRALASAGHFVLEARDGPSAREVLSQHGHKVQLIISDVLLPRAGDDFLGWAKRICPNAALLLVSGRESEGTTAANRLGAQFLAKPFTPSELMVVVRQTLEQAANVDDGGAGTAARLVVLLVDDDDAILQSYQRLLAECDFDALTVQSGQHALRLLEDRRVDAIVTDQLMPGLDGVGLLELVQQRFPRCVRILCSGHPASDSVRSAVTAGCVHRVLAKTMHAVAFRDEIERAVVEGVERA